MNYTNLVQAINQQRIATNSKMKLKSLTLGKSIAQMTDPSTSPRHQKIWATQVSIDDQARFAVLVPSGPMKYVRGVVMVNNPISDEPTAVNCSDNGIQIGQLIQFDPVMLMNATISIAMPGDTTALDLKAIYVSPINFKDHNMPAYHYLQIGRSDNHHGRKSAKAAIIAI